MASIIQQLKGTAAEVAAKTYAVGVLVWNETAKRWHGGDGVTVGGIPMARYDERNDGSLGDAQRVETGATNTVTVADTGKAIIGNRATAIAFNLDPAASLTSKFVAIFKNIGAGAMTVVPNGAELIDGANAAITVPTGSSVIIKGDGTSFRTFLSNGDVTGSAINNATALTGANLADDDKIGVYDTSAAGLRGMSISELIAGVFKTARTIANAQFASATFKLFNAAGTPRALTFNTTALTADRSVTMPDGNVTLPSGVLQKGWTEVAPVATTSGTTFEWTSIPAGVTDVEMWFDGVSLSGADNMLVQIGTAGAPVATGYVASSGVAGAAARVGSNSGYILFSNVATLAHTGRLGMHRTTGNTWVSDHSMSIDAASGNAIAGGGSVSLAGALDYIRLVRAGSQNFDAGSVKLRYR